MKNFAICVAIVGGVSGFWGDFGSHRAEASTPLCLINHVSLLENASLIESATLLPQFPNSDLKKWSKYCFFDKPGTTSFGYNWQILHQIHNPNLVPAIHIDEPVKYHV